MFGLHTGTRVFLKTGVTDGRVGIDTLRNLVVKTLRQETCNGIFAFCNRRCNRIKLLWYHDGGYYLAVKRLDRGTVDWPRSADQVQQMSAAQLMLLIKGVAPATQRKVRR